MPKLFKNITITETKTDCPGRTKPTTSLQWSFNYINSYHTDILTNENINFTTQEQITFFQGMINIMKCLEAEIIKDSTIREEI